MQNLKFDGKTKTVVATDDVVSGSVYQVEALNGVYAASVKAGESVVVALEGVYEIPKDAAAIGLGKKVYIDATTGKATATSTNNKFFGVAFEAASAADTVVQVKVLSV